MHLQGLGGLGAAANSIGVGGWAIGVLSADVLGIWTGNETSRMGVSKSVIGLLNI